MEEDGCKEKDSFWHAEAFRTYVLIRPVHRSSINRIIEGVPINRIAFGLTDKSKSADYSIKDHLLTIRLCAHSSLWTNQAKETPAGAVCDVICDLVSIDVATEQL